ncbi:MULTISPECIES: hypothetical protein [Gordonia]|uniref:Uncharacterized protein n=1 Tax=Gordonia tangerina TaxID=2911060 RepID=A0ABS9DKX4_9ACTN|nr:MULTISPECIES: hypothetical protein [Gordonia]MCF3939801.1 hypothetical protein [Gordonia tangerina]
MAVGQIGLWTRDISEGRGSTGYWFAETRRIRGYWQRVGAERRDMFVYSQLAEHTVRR